MSQLFLRVSLVPSLAGRRSARTAEDHAEADFVGQIRGIFQESGERYGAPPLHAELRAQGIRITQKRMARLMKKRRSPAPAQEAAADRD